MAVENRLDVGGRQVGAGPILASRVPARENQFEVPSVSCCVCVSYSPRHQKPPKTRPRRQPRDGISEPAVNTGKADGQAVIQGPTLTWSLAERIQRDSDRAHDLRVLLRHRVARISRPGAPSTYTAQWSRSGWRAIAISCDSNTGMRHQAVRSPAAPD